mmetsp:Transcript_36598/g.44694  ORF Transcript_36598/g.44694 Transcript_36598/m.44694 type:complete len:231 (+) Transcript_36598:1292-1984(+)
MESDHELPQALQIANAALTLSIDQEPEGQSRELLTVEGAPAGFLMARQHLHTIHLLHLFPGVATVGHSDHVALVRVNHLRHVARVDWDAEFVTLREQGVRFNQVCALHALGVAVAKSIESILEVLEGGRGDLRFDLTIALLLTTLHICEPVVELGLSELLLRLLPAVRLAELYAQGHDLTDQIEVRRVRVLRLMNLAQAKLAVDSRHLVLNADWLGVLRLDQVGLLCSVH